MTGFKENDIKILVKLIDNIQNKELLKFGISKTTLNGVSMYRDFIEKNIICVAENIENEYKFFDMIRKRDLSFYTDNKNQIVLDKSTKIIIESILYQNKIEEKQIIDLIKDFSFNPDIDLKYEFNYFFCMQYFRTPRIRKNFEENIKKLKRNYPDFDIHISFFANMLSIYFAQRMVLRLSNELHCYILLYINNTKTNFITGDTPIVCIHGKAMKEKTVFHYPITPKISIELFVMQKNLDMKNEENQIVELNDDNINIIEDLNQILADNCVNEIYAKEESDFGDCNNNN